MSKKEHESYRKPRDYTTIKLNWTMRQEHDLNTGKTFYDNELELIIGL